MASVACTMRASSVLSNAGCGVAAASVLWQAGVMSMITAIRKKSGFFIFSSPQPSHNQRLLVL